MTVSAEDTKVRLSILRERLRMCALLYNLPQNIKEAKEQIEKNKAKLENFKSSQEGVAN